MDIYDKVAKEIVRQVTKGGPGSGRKKGIGAENNDDGTVQHAHNAWNNLMALKLGVARNWKGKEKALLDNEIKRWNEEYLQRQRKKRGSSDLL